MDIVANESSYIDTSVSSLLDTTSNDNILSSLLSSSNDNTTTLSPTDYSSSSSSVVISLNSSSTNTASNNLSKKRKSQSSVSEVSCHVINKATNIRDTRIFKSVKNLLHNTSSMDELEDIVTLLKPVIEKRSSIDDDEVNYLKSLTIQSVDKK